MKSAESSLDETTPQEPTRRPMDNRITIYRIIVGLLKLGLFALCVVVIVGITEYAWTDGDRVDRVVSVTMIAVGALSLFYTSYRRG
jgi:hypothetical protein